MIWFISGPSCIGKSYFIKWDETNRIEEITYGEENHDNLKESFKSLQMHYARGGNWIELKDNVIVVDLVITQDDTIHPWNRMWKQICNSVLEKKVIVLGVPPSEYKKRIKKRIKKDSHTSGVRFSRLLKNTSTDAIIQFYKDWISELKSKGMSYLLVESKHYKILEEEDFLNMLKEDI
jgi:hypothetical protein|tara:strand:- start:383 stop:916 length:534 start_codon:yes stop_codon:yes gene_type:complete